MCGSGRRQSGGAITRQLRRLGASCDWAHERFTMDERYQRAVTHTFVELHKRGLIYRDKRLVNWDPKFQTAISDLEVDNREVQGHMWHFKYPLEGGETYKYVERDEDGKSCSRKSGIISRSPRPGPKPCSATARSRSTRTTSATGRSSASFARSRSGPRSIGA